MSEVYLNGAFLGEVDNPTDFVAQVRLERRKNKVSSNVNIIYSTNRRFSRRVSCFKTGEIISAHQITATPFYPLDLDRKPHPMSIAKTYSRPHTRKNNLIPNKSTSYKRKMRGEWKGGT